MGRSTALALWVLTGLVIGVTLFFLISFSPANERDSIPEVGSLDSEREIAARVGPYVLYSSDLAIIRADEDAIESWTRDQLLACAAEEAGLENPAISSFVAARARQIYLRDRMIDEIVASVASPTDTEIENYMALNPELFLIERHYFQIIAADSAMAESLHTRLGWGQNFQVTAQNSSLGQKAAIGGDLGFVTGGEMLAQGLPNEIALLDGLSEIVPSSLGWHIFKVSETQALTDSLRVMRSAAEVLYNSRIEAALDSVLQSTENRLSTEVAH